MRYARDGVLEFGDARILRGEFGVFGEGFGEDVGEETEVGGFCPFIFDGLEGGACYACGLGLGHGFDEGGGEAGVR